MDRESQDLGKQKLENDTLSRKQTTILKGPAEDAEVLRVLAPAGICHAVCESHPRASRDLSSLQDEIERLGS